MEEDSEEEMDAVAERAYIPSPIPKNGRHEPIPKIRSRLPRFVFRPRRNILGTRRHAPNGRPRPFHSDLHETLEAPVHFPNYGKRFSQRKSEAASSI